MLAIFPFPVFTKKQKNKRKKITYASAAKMTNNQCAGVTIH